MTKFDVPEGLEQSSLKALEISRNTGKVRRGTNEVTKVIEREKAKIVYIAQDVQPPEIVAHLPALCDEKKIPFIYIREKNELGRAGGIDVSTAAVAVVDPGNAKKEIADIIDKIKGIRTGKASKEESAEKPEKKAEKKGEKKAGKKAEAPKKEETKKEEKKAESKKPEKKEAKKEAPKPEAAPAKEEKPAAPAEAAEKPAEKPKEETKA